MTTTIKNKILADTQKAVFESNNLVSESKKKINRVKKLIVKSDKLIEQANYLFITSKKRISENQHLLVLTINVLISYYLFNTLQRFSHSLELSFVSEQRCLNTIDSAVYLTPQEHLRQIMNHPFQTGKCPNCSNPLLRPNYWLESWNCSNCGWIDDLF